MALLLDRAAESTDPYSRAMTLQDDETTGDEIHSIDRYLDEGSGLQVSVETVGYEFQRGATRCSSSGDTIQPSGGRIVFRSRFVDYEGEYVDHGHILLHQDNGMMQAGAAYRIARHGTFEPRFGPGSRQYAARHGQTDETALGLNRANIDGGGHVEPVARRGQHLRSGFAGRC